MYTTIEADIENGRIKGAEVGRIPDQAHVLITCWVLWSTSKNVERMIFPD